MSVARLRAVVVALIVTLVAGVTAPLLAAAQPTCSLAEPGCDSTPTIAECCCQQDRSSGQPATPAEQRAQAAAGPALAVSIAQAPFDALPATPPLEPLQSVSLLLCLLDLPTLFASLLI